MSQHDGIISNDTGANVRSDINNALSAIFTTHSGATEPSTTYSYQLWMDTTNNVLKIRNSANSAWYTLPISPVANNTVDINGGTIDGVTIGGASAGAGTFSSLTATTADINGGTIDGATIGGSSAAAGTFTGVTVSSTSPTINFTDTNGVDYQIYANSDAFSILDSTNSEFGARFFANGASSIYHNGSEKLATTSTGINVTGTGTFDSIKIDESAAGPALHPAYITSENFGYTEYYPFDAGANQNAIRIRTTYGAGGGGRYWQTGSGGSYGSDVTGYTYTDRMVLTTSGNVLVGYSSNLDNAKLQAYSTGRAFGVITNSSSGFQDAMNISNLFNTAYYPIRFFVNGAVNNLVGSISCSTTATAYNTSSDYRLKEDWQPMSGSIDRLKNLKPVNFAWKADSTRVDGFLAHEAAEVVPEAVSGEKDAVEAIGNITDAEGNVVQEGVIEPEELTEGQVWTKTEDRPIYQGIDQSKLVPLLTAALQEAVAKIEALETRIAALED